MPPLRSCVDLSAATQRLKAFLAACLSVIDNMITAATTTATNNSTQPASSSPYLQSIQSDSPESPADCHPLPSVTHFPSSTVTLVTPSPSSTTGPLRRPTSTPAATVASSGPSRNSPKMLAIATNPSSATTATACSSVDTADHDHGRGGRRPKLSLQTSCLPVSFGKSTTALSFGLTTCYSASPTVRNTFTNAYDGFGSSVTSSAPPTASSATAATTAGTTPSLSSKYMGSGSSFMNVRSNHASEAAPPYQLPLGVRSILRNSPIPASSIRRPSLSAPAGNGRRKLFHATKRVNYRFPIEEEIKTVRFLAKHSDLLSSEDSLSTISSSSSERNSISSSSPSSNEEESDSSLGSSSGSCASDDDLTKTHINPDETVTETKPLRKRKRRYPRSDRQILAAGLRDGLLGASDETPKTPVRSRRKRPREWKWTLGPIRDGYVQPAADPEASLADTEVSPVRPAVES